MPVRRRPTSEFEATQSEAGPRIVTLDSPIGGYNGYTSPDLLSPKFWVASSNVYAGQFGVIRRARWAPIFNSSATGYAANGFRDISMFSFLDLVNQVTWLMFENNDSIVATGPRWMTRYPLAAWSQNAGTLQAQFLLNIWGIFAGTGNQAFPLALSFLNGPYSRAGLNNILFEANGLFRSKILIGVSSAYSVSYNNSPLLETWGIDAPDVSPTITLSGGTTANIVAATGAVRTSNVVTITATAALPANFIVGAFVNISGVTDTTFNSAAGTAFQILSVASPNFTYAQMGTDATSGGGTATVQITKTVGRSYQYAWENVRTGHVSAPSPASQFVKYSNQTGTIDLVETGVLNVLAGDTAVVGTNTNFSPAWVGKVLWVENSNKSTRPFIASVTDAAHLTLAAGMPGGAVNARFQVYDPQVTHVKLYATGDGGSVYFLFARNAVIYPGNSPASGAGLEFKDTANSEPPNSPYSSEVTQIYNVPPPIGKFVEQYQGRVIAYGVAASPQTFFYSNIEATVVGQPPESFGTLNTVTLPLGDGQLNGMANLPTGLLIWSNRQDMFKLTGLLTDNTVANPFQLGATIQRLPYKIGAASPYATAVTPLGAIWLSSDREVWLFTDHYAPKNVGKPVQDVLNRINGSRLGFAKMSYYKRGDRSWLALAVALDSSTFNNKLLLLDLDLLASNGQPSFFTFDLATNAPTWYQYDINCEAMATVYDANSTNHLLVGDVDLITDVDWQPGFFTVSAEQSVTGSNKLHAFGNEDPHMIKTFQWMRALTNQIPKNLAAQGWAWSIDAFDDDAFVIGVNPLTTNIIPGVDSRSNPLFLEYSPALFKFGGVRPVKGRRFQIGTTFPSAPGLFELRGFEVSYNSIVGR